MDNQYGLYFPLVLEAGTPIKPSLVDSIDSSVRIILSWAIGTRNFENYFGTPLKAMLGKPSSVERLTAIQMYLRQAFSMWERRLLIEDIAITASESGKLSITITGTIVSNDSPYTLTETL